MTLTQNGPTSAPTSDWPQRPRVAGGPVYGNYDFGEFIRTAVIDDLRLDATTHLAGSVVPDHAHAAPLLFFVLEGEVEDHCRGVTTIGKSGSLMALPEGVSHSARFLSTTRIFTVEPGPKWLDRVGARPVARQIERTDWSDRLTPLILKVYAGFTLLDAGPAGPLAMQGYLQALLAELVQPTEVRGEPLWLRDARRYLDSHLVDRLDLEALARRVGVHPVHLSRSFRRFFGVTITDYRRHGRLAFAMARLSTSNDPVSLVAAEAGFADQSHMTRAFRRSFGTTPAGYRAGIRERAGRRP